MRSLLVAVAFLSIVPVHFRVLPVAAVVARSRWWYPAVGLLLGALLGGWTAGLRHWLGPTALSAFLVLLVWVGLTGALHVDGFCDLCDGLFGGRTAEDRLRIMKDPHLGTFGLVGGVLLLLGKFVGVEATLSNPRGPWIVGAAVLVGRCLALAMAAGSRYPRSEGTGKTLVEATHAGEGWLFAAVAALVTVLALAGPDWGEVSGRRLRWALVPFLAALLVVLVLKQLCRRRLGGITGDCLGAAIETAELTFLLAAAVRG